MTMTEADVVGTSTDLAVSPSGAPMIPPSAEEARRAMEVYQEISHALLTPQDVQEIKTRKGTSTFPKRSAFQKLANAYRVSTEIVKRELTHDDDGNLLRCDVIVRATHPDGRYSEGDGACSASEDRFAKNREKIDHDLPATAVTRAKNRAISDLVAFGAVSAEEAEAGGTAAGGGDAAPSVPTWALPMNDIPGVAQSINDILEAAGVEKRADIVTEIGNTIFKQADGSFPFIAARVVDLIAKAIEKLTFEKAFVENEINQPDVTSDETSDATDDAAGDEAS